MAEPSPEIDAERIAEFLRGVLENPSLWVGFRGTLGPRGPSETFKGQPANGESDD
jgi:hypothetical protein